MIFPDIRSFWETATPPSYVWKKNILNPEKPKRPWLMNLYFSKPDYEDPHKKVFYSAFGGVKIAGFWSLMEVVAMKSRNPTLAWNVVGRSFFFIGTTFITYGAVTTAVANLRGKKDDYLNHAIGGASIGFIYGYAKRSSGYGATVAAFGVIGGLLLKWIYVNDRPLLSRGRIRDNNLVWGSQKYSDFRVKHRHLQVFEDKPRTERYVN